MAEQNARSGRHLSPAQAMTETTSDPYWQIAAILIIGVILAAGVLWASRYATGSDWDEAAYLNRAIEDRYMFQEEGLYGLLRAVGARDVCRPPAYRMMVIPVTIPLGVSAATARYLSIFVFAATLWIIYRLGRRLAGPACGALATLLLATNPSVLACSVRFYTEPSAYLSVAGVLYFLMRRIQSTPRGRFEILGLGFFLGLGLLSKTSFLLMAAPMLAVAFVLAWRKKALNLHPEFLIKASLIGGLLAFPWWLRNWWAALAYARYSGAYTRHSFEGTAFDVLTHWLYAFSRGTIGIALLLLIVAILVRAFVSRRRLSGMEPHQRAILWICLAAGIPLILLQITGKNHNMRLITPSFLPLAVALGLVASMTAWTRVRLLTGFATALLAIQTATIATPSFLSTPARETNLLGGPPSMLLAMWQEWDWDALRKVCQGRGLTHPVIQYLGNGPVYCIPLISHPWIRRNEPATVTWLWRYEEGAINWENIHTKISEADVVITALNHRGVAIDKQYLDNAHNGEFAALLEKDLCFEGPVEIDVGAPPPTKIVAFFRVRPAPAEMRRLP